METELHVTRVEELIVELNDGDADDKKDAVATALTGLGEDISPSPMKAPCAMLALRNSGKTEYHEITSYRALCGWAAQLGFSNVDVLRTTLDEEKHTDEIFITISARGGVEALTA